MKNQNEMDGDNTHLEKNPNGESGNMVHDDSTVLQSVRVRHRPVLADFDNWKFVESEFRFVLYCGSLLWLIFLLSMAF
jgi:hypothetical protein